MKTAWGTIMHSWVSIMAKSSYSDSKHPTTGTFLEKQTTPYGYVWETKCIDCKSKEARNWYKLYMRCKHWKCKKKSNQIQKDSQSYTQNISNDSWLLTFLSEILKELFTKFSNFCSVFGRGLPWWKRPLNHQLNCVSDIQLREVICKKRMTAIPPWPPLTTCS